MKLDHLVLAVSDLERSLSWYAAVLPALGFRKTREHVWLNEADQAVEVRQAAEPGHGYERYGVGLNHFAVTAPSRQALAEVGDAVRAAGFEVPAVQAFDEDRALFLKDPDGMRIEVTAYG